MKDFRTELKVSPARTTIRLNSAIVTQGSCFADAIGRRLSEHKLRTLVNPFGVVYNPESIHKVLTYGTFNESAPEHTYLRHNDLFFNYNVHSEFSAPTIDKLKSDLNNTIGSTHYYLKDADWLIITYGTAWVYHRNDTGEVVGNCHKLPSAMFSKSLLAAEVITESFRVFFEQLRRLNPRMKIILTVSPVRHIKDTLELNSVSKAVLRVACHQIASQHNDVEYFPAFEMMVDDLRDYRFYGSDMLHPSADAETYIWEKFMERYFSPELKDIARRWTGILADIRHKPFHPQSAAHQRFLAELLKKLEELSPVINVEDEILRVKQQMLK